MTFAHPEFDDHESVVFCRDRDSGLRAIIAVHRTRHGRAVGGCRVRDYATEDEALTDVLRLSHGMSHKAALAALPCGGAKAVIIGAPGVATSAAALAAFGRAIARLGGAYVTAEDVGIGRAELEIVKTQTQWVLGTDPAIGDGAPYTALGVFHAMRGALEHVRGDAGMAGVRVAVQGVGAVGSELCRLLHEAGAQLVVADVDTARVVALAATYGAQTATPEEIHRAPADVFAPCALGAVLNERTIPQLEAAIVVGAANNQLATAADGERLHARGVTYVADYLASAGGIMSGIGELEGHDPDDIQGRVRGIADTARLVLGQADARGLSASAAADAIAGERLAEPDRQESRTR